MALRYAILGLLTAESMSGYDLSKWMDRGLGNVWSAHASQIYPELARLVEEGSIEEVQGEPGPRRRRLYGITPAGTSELHEWLSSRPRPGAGGAQRGAPPRCASRRARRPRSGSGLRRDGGRTPRAGRAERTLRDEASQHGSPLAPLRLAFDCGARLETALAEWAEAAAAERSPRRPVARRS